MTAAPAPYVSPALGRPYTVLVAAPVPPAVAVVPRPDTTPRAAANAVRPDTAHRDTVPDLEQAVAHGRRDAGAQDLVGRGVVGFIGGLPVGFFGPFVLLSREPVTLLPPGLGVAVVVAAAGVGSTEPPSYLVTAAAVRGPAYETTYRAAFADRLRERRQRFAFVGGGLGAATGLGILIYLATHIRFD